MVSESSLIVILSLDCCATAYTYSFEVVYGERDEAFELFEGINFENAEKAVA